MRRHCERFWPLMRFGITVGACLAVIALVVSPVPSARATFPGRNGLLLVARFSSHWTGDTGLWLMRPTGSRARRVVSFPDRESCSVDVPSAISAPDGKRIAYIADWSYNSPQDCKGYPHPPLPTGTALVTEITTVDMDGPHRHLLLRPSDSSLSLSFSPGGQRLAITGYGTITIIDAVTGKQRRLIRISDYQSAVSWGPAADIAYEHGGWIYAVRSDGSHRHRVARSASDGTVTSLNWSPDVQHIALERYIEDIVPDAATPVHRSVRSFGAVPPVARPADCSCSILRYSDIFVTSVTGGPPRRLTRSAQAREPIWSPDGSHSFHHPRT